MRADTAKANSTILKKTTPINCDDVERDRDLNNIQDFIYLLRPDNTKKKKIYDLNIW